MHDPAEQAAREIVRKWKVAVGTAAVPERDYYEAHDYDVLVTNIARLIDTRERAARQEERRIENERCAQFAETFFEPSQEQSDLPAFEHGVMIAEELRKRRAPAGELTLGQKIDQGLVCKACADPEWRPRYSHTCVKPAGDAGQEG